MKRSKRIRLLLVGGISAGSLSGCGPEIVEPPPVTTTTVFTNNHYLPGAGYYHAPFRAWFPFRYNHYDPQKRLFFHGGGWAPVPYESVVNISSPTPDAVARAEQQRTDVRRGGFGSSGGRTGGRIGA